MTGQPCQLAIGTIVPRGYHRRSIPISLSRCRCHTENFSPSFPRRFLAKRNPHRDRGSINEDSPLGGVKRMTCLLERNFLGHMLLQFQIYRTWLRFEYLNWFANNLAFMRARTTAVDASLRIIKIQLDSRVVNVTTRQLLKFIKLLKFTRIE